jgi:hypothetical protein
MRRRYGGYRAPRTPRPKKIRPMVRVKERIAKKGGRCAACKGRYEAGTPVTVVNIRRKVYHTAGCVPANAGQLPTSGGIQVNPTPDAVVKALSTTWALGEGKLVGMLALENALVIASKSIDITPSIEKAFDRYNKLKAMAMRPGSENEGNMAARMAIIDLVKLVF